MPGETIHYAGLGAVHIDWSEHYEIEFNGRIYRFEWHDYCGPWPVRKDGELFSRQWGQRNPVWKAFHWWLWGGKRHENFKCIYDVDTKNPMEGE